VVTQDTPLPATGSLAQAGVLPRGTPRRILEVPPSRPSLTDTPACPKLLKR